MWLKWWSLTRSGNVDVFVITFVTGMPHLGRFHHVNSCICVSVVNLLTHWGWVTNICVGNLTIIGSDNGLSPGRRQAIIWTNDGILLIGPFRTNFSEILIGIHTFSSRNMHMKMSSAKCLPFFLSLNVLNQQLMLFVPGMASCSRHAMPWYSKHRSLCQRHTHWRCSSV